MTLPSSEHLPEQTSLRPDGAPAPSAPVPGHDRVLDERGTRCPMPVIALARAVVEDPGARLLLLSDDPAASTDIPAWCSLRGRRLAWTGPAPDGVGAAFLVVSLDSD